jgi:hypothetical protein
MEIWPKCLLKMVRLRRTRWKNLPNLPKRILNNQNRWKCQSSKMKKNLRAKVRPKLRK